MKLTDKLSEVSRRSFLKGMAALGAAGAVAGCSKNDNPDIIGGGGGNLEGSITPEDLSDLSKATVAYATCPHNCGPAVRCVSKAWVVNGRIVRVTTDDTETDIDGKVRDKNKWNDPRQLSCAKGHAYKYRVYHSGRLKYPLKQTKERGDMTGFVRISWEQAYKEVIQKHRAIYAKYGPAAIHVGANNSSSGAWAAVNRALHPITGFGSSRQSYSDHSFHQYNYGGEIAGVPGGTVNYGANHIGTQIPAVASGVIKNWVSFGTNSMTTNNTLSYPYLRANQEAKRLNPDFKHYVISPELTDTGVLNATDWVQIRNQTDPALIAAMIYHMLDKTFREDGSIIPMSQGGLLDIDYIDTCVYGFFDSPEYYVETATGNISTTPQGAGWNKVNEVEPGKSYASWIMGSDERLTRANYSASNNYTANAYGSKVRAAKCSLPVKGQPAHSADMSSTKYHTKKNYMEPKTPDWAEKITGTPASVIRELAELYAKPENHPILTEWTGGLQKSENGVITLFAIQTLFALTKTWGYTHGSTGGMYQTWGGWTGTPFGSAPSGLENLPNIPVAATSGVNLTALTASVMTNAGSVDPSTPAISCKEHFNGVYFAFKEELDRKGFKGGANPYWDGESRYLNDDAGAKSQVLFLRLSAGSTYKPIDLPDKDGNLRTYYDWAKDANGEPIYVGKRMFIGNAGTQFNQVGNTNWLADMMRLLDLAQDDPEDADTFCWATFDIYMSPQALFSDYVFPMAGTLEVADNTSVGGVTTMRLPLVTPPGEAKDAWEAAFIGWNVQSELGDYQARREDGAPDYNKQITPNAGYAYISHVSGLSITKPNYVSINSIYRQMVQDKCSTVGSRFSGMTVEQAIAAQIVPKTPTTTPTVSAVGTTDLRKSLVTYLLDPASGPFIKQFTGSSRPFKARTQFNHSMATHTDKAQQETLAVRISDGYTYNMENTHGRMTCYAEYAVKTWERAYDIYHGWLDASERGQKNEDYEGDPKIYPIPLYYHFEDAFNEMYGVFNTKNPNPQDNWKLIGSKPSSNDISLIQDRLTLTVGSTHDRYRSHSSQAENPYLRELNHRVKGGGWLSGNDWNEYCVVPEVHAPGTTTSFNKMISTAVEKRDMETASWHEFWMNDEDAAQFGINDGDLIRVSNPVGAIRVIARVTKRIVRGHGQIHQGAWYDPNPVDGVDDGACANTIMSNRPSKFDNGNAVHCAYCVVEKETSY